MGRLTIQEAKEIMCTWLPAGRFEGEHSHCSGCEAVIDRTAMYSDNHLHLRALVSRLHACHSLGFEGSSKPSAPSLFLDQ